MGKSHFIAGCLVSAGKVSINIYFANKDRPWKYQDFADAMKEIINEDKCNDTYGRIRMYQVLLLKQPEGVHIPSERTVYRVMN